MVATTVYERELSTGDMHAAHMGVTLRWISNTPRHACFMLKNNRDKLRSFGTLARVRLYFYLFWRLRHLLSKNWSADYITLQMYTSVKNAMFKTRIQTQVKPSQEKKFKWPVQFIVWRESGDAEADLVLQASLVSQGLREIVVGLVPQASMVRLGPRDRRGLKVLREIRGLLDLEAIRAHTVSYTHLTLPTNREV